MENDELGISDILEGIMDREVVVGESKTVLKWEDINKEDLDNDERNLKGGIFEYGKRN